MLGKIHPAVCFASNKNPKEQLYAGNINDELSVTWLVGVVSGGIFESRDPQGPALKWLNLCGFFQIKFSR